MKKILLGGKLTGIEVLVDDDLFSMLNHWKWQLNTSGYVSRSIHVKKKYKIQFMHHLVMPKVAGYQIDHINRNKLDNRKENLRYATISQQVGNKSGHSDSKSKYKGVSFVPGNKYSKWQAKIKYQSKSYGLGSFTEEVVAAAAYNQKAKELFGEFAFLNSVPDDVRVPSLEERVRSRNLIVANERTYRSPQCKDDWINNPDHPINKNKLGVTQ